MPREPKVADEDDVINTLRSRGVICTLAVTKVSWLVEYQGEAVFIPRGLTRGGYTRAQLDHIERWCAYWGLDLLPLNVHIN